MSGAQKVRYLEDGKLEFSWIGEKCKRKFLACGHSETVSVCKYDCGWRQHRRVRIRISRTGARAIECQ